jgi:Concanavalin A-like lectin/glucanases superfamily
VPRWRSLQRVLCYSRQLQSLSTLLTPSLCERSVCVPPPSPSNTHSSHVLHPHTGVATHPRHRHHRRRQGAGGALWEKGATAALTDSELDAPWRAFGLELSAEGRLRYAASQGGELPPVNVTAARALRPGAWAHVALVHGGGADAAAVVLYVDGAEAARGALPAHMRVPAGRVNKRCAVVSGAGVRVWAGGLRNAGCLSIWEEMELRRLIVPACERGLAQARLAKESSGRTQCASKS